MRLPLSRPLSPLLLAAALGAAACDGGQPAGSAGAAASEGDVGGVLVIATPGRPGTYMPPVITSLTSRQIADLVFDPLVEIGPDLNTLGDAGFTPRLAERWTWAPDSLSIAFHLHPAARWHDGRPVRSSDVRFTMDVARDSLTGSSDRQYLARVDSVSTPDSLTAVVWFRERSPEQFYDAGGRLHILPEHLLRDVPRPELGSSAFGSAPVGSGPFRFVRADGEQAVELGANTAYHLGRPKLDRVIVQIATSPAAAAAQLFAGEADFYEALTLDHMATVASTPDVVARVGRGTAYSFLSFNLRDPADRTRPHPLFGDRELRRALSMLVDRETAARSVVDTLGAVGLGPFPRAIPVADTTVRQIAYDTAAGRRLLDSLGWRDADGDGVRERAGVPLRFTLLAPSSSALRVKSALILQEQLAQHGVKVELQNLDYQTLGATMAARRFDVVYGSWVLTDGSPAGTRNTWGSRGANPPAGQNYGAWVNPAFDAQVDSGLATFDAAARRAHFARAYQIAVDDAPALWMYEPKNAYGIHRRFQTPAMRPTGWWLDVRHWWIPADQRIARDQAGLPTVAQR